MNTPKHKHGIVGISLWALPLSVVIGSACALFLWMMDEALRLRLSHPELLWGLPLAGMAMLWAYHVYGKGSDRGNNLLIDEIHEKGLGVPRRMAPLILISTVLTHLFGGSAGREGTAVQMGGSLAESWSRILNFNPEQRRFLLMAGMAAGFGAVFGTPLAGAIFAMEVLTYGRLEWRSALPCLVAAFSADWTCRAWGIRHSSLVILPCAFDGMLLAKVLLASVAFGLLARLFISVDHALGAWFRRSVRPYWIKAFIGGVILIALTQVLGTSDYLGLGVEGMVSAFHSSLIDPLAWAWKGLYTVLTLASGFKGGEVTPLFFMGATFGNALSAILETPMDLLAGLGMVAVFAGASNTPLACVIMGAELFGWGFVAWLALACYTAWLFSGRAGIYHAQKGKGHGV